MPARYSIGVIVAYAILALLLVFVVGQDSSVGFSWPLYFLLGVTGFFLARYLSTRYVLDDSNFTAWRIFGSRRIPLEDVRAIEYASLRELAPTGGMLGIGSFGWRGRMYSQLIGEFDSIYTDAAHGLLVSAGSFPVYVSPKDATAFARELSRRARSYSGPLLKDVGNPTAEP